MSMIAKHVTFNDHEVANHKGFTILSQSAPNRQPRILPKIKLLTFVSNSRVFATTDNSFDIIFRFRQFCRGNANAFLELICSCTIDRSDNSQLFLDEFCADLAEGDYINAFTIFSILNERIRDNIELIVRSSVAGVDLEHTHLNEKLPNNIRCNRLREILAKHGLSLQSDSLMLKMPQQPNPQPTVVTSNHSNSIPVQRTNTPNSRFGVNSKSA